METMNIYRHLLPLKPFSNSLIYPDSTVYNPKFKVNQIFLSFLQTCNLIVFAKSLITYETQFRKPEMEFKEFVPRFKSDKTRFKFSAGLNLETFDTILSRTNQI